MQKFLRYPIYKFTNEEKTILKLIKIKKYYHIHLKRVKLISWIAFTYGLYSIRSAFIYYAHTHSYSPLLSVAA